MSKSNCTWGAVVHLRRSDYGSMNELSNSTTFVSAKAVMAHLNNFAFMVHKWPNQNVKLTNNFR